MVPLFKKNLLKTDNITIDSKSGYSGAGKNLEKKFKHKNLFSSTFAYSTKNHRHICEIDQELYKYTKKKINFSFNPHLLPTFRGILTSLYIYTNKDKTGKHLRNCLLKFYKNSILVLLNSHTFFLPIVKFVRAIDFQIATCLIILYVKTVFFS